MTKMKKFNTSDYVLAIAVISSFLVAFLSSAVTILLPSLAEEFTMNNIVQNWVATIFFLTVAIVSVPFGKLAGKFGLKKSLIWGTFIFLIGAIGAAMAFSSESLLFFRVLQGIGAALLNITTLALIVKILPPKDRGKGIGLTVSGVYIGLSLSPILGGILNYNFGWRSVFYLTIPIILITLIITLIKVNDEWTEGKNDPFDMKGSVLFSIGILCLIYGFTILNEMFGMILTIIGLIILGIFAFIELKEKFPVFEMRLFKNKTFLSANIAALISYFATFVVIYILNYHLQYVRGLDSQTAGILLIITPLMMAIIVPFSGRLSDKINPQILSAIGMGVVTIGMVIFSLCFMGEPLPLYVIGIGMFLQGVGYGLFSSPNTNAIMSSVPPKETPLASAAVSTVRVIGQTLSMGMLTVIFSIVMGNVLISPENFSLLTESSFIACLISTICCLAAVFVSLLGLKSKGKSNIPS